MARIGMGSGLHDRAEFIKEDIIGQYSHLKVYDTCDKGDHVWVLYAPLYNSEEAIVDCNYVFSDTGDGWDCNAIEDGENPKYYDIPKEWLNKITGPYEREMSKNSPIRIEYLEKFYSKVELTYNNPEELLAIEISKVLNDLQNYDFLIDFNKEAMISKNHEYTKWDLRVIFNDKHLLNELVKTLDFEKDKKVQIKHLSSIYVLPHDIEEEIFKNCLPKLRKLRNKKEKNREER